MYLDQKFVDLTSAIIHSNVFPMIASTLTEEHRRRKLGENMINSVRARQTKMNSVK
jgi:hypothetical protein